MKKTALYLLATVKLLITIAHICGKEI